MCGIVGYVGFADKTCDVVCGGLEKLDSRGYDSAGICLIGKNGASVFKSPGKISRLVAKLGSPFPEGGAGIGHTRWATQGSPESCANAHPHVAGSVSVVHNGVVENWKSLRAALKKRGRVFSSDTDTEVIAHLIDEFHSAGHTLAQSVRKAFGQITGCSAVAAVSETEPDTVVAAKRFSPIVLADTGDEKFVASDVLAFAGRCREVTVLADGDCAVLKPSGITITDSDGKTVKRPLRTVDDSGWAAADKGGFSHHMIKEIYDQPHAVAETLRGRTSFALADFDGLDLDFARSFDRVVFVGCGTSHYASVAGRYVFESLSQIPAAAETASEFCHRRPALDSKTLVIAVSQSGETADTSHALAEARSRGALTLAVTNNPFGKMTDETGRIILTKAGREISVASTKTFTAQVAVFCALGLFFAKARGNISRPDFLRMEKQLRGVPELQAKCLALDDEISELAAEFCAYENFLYLGRGLAYPVALEGALKLKEVSYIHAEAAAAGEIKHGPIALIDEKMPAVFVFPSSDEPHACVKILSNIAEVKARRGRIIAVTPGDDLPHLDENDRTIRVPECGRLAAPMVSVTVLQLFAYHVSRALGKDVDQPRNLAKVVTVE